MSSTEAVNATLGNLRPLLPIPVYLSLHGHAAQAHIIAIESRSGHRSDVLGIDVRFGDVVYQAPCTAGKVMRQAIYHKFPGVPRSSKDTLDAWHKMKVVVNGHVVRLEELIPSDARRGLTVATGDPEVSGRNHDLAKILRGPKERIIGLGADIPTLAVDPPRQGGLDAAGRASKRAGKRPDKRVGKRPDKRAAGADRAGLKLITMHLTTLKMLFGNMHLSKEQILERLMMDPAAAAEMIGREDAADGRRRRAQSGPVVA